MATTATTATKKTAARKTAVKLTRKTAPAPNGATKEAPAKATEKLATPAKKTAEKPAVTITNEQAYETLADKAQRGEWQDRAHLFDVVAKLVAERNRLEISQHDMAVHLAMKQPSLSLIEGNKQAPSWSQLQRYARRVGMTLELKLTH